MSICSVIDWRLGSWIHFPRLSFVLTLMLNTSAWYSKDLASKSHQFPFPKLAIQSWHGVELV